MINKYDPFFESVKGYVLKTKLSYPEEIKGISELAIDKLERKFKVTFPKSLRSYYTFMGEFCKIICTSDDLNFTEKKLQHAIEKVKQYDVYEGLKAPMEFYGRNNNNQHILLSNLMDLDDILFIEYIEDVGVFRFINCAEQNPWPNLIWITGSMNENHEDAWNYQYEIYPQSFIGHFRHVLFFAIQFKYGKISNHYDPELYKRVNIEELSWAKCYVEHRKKYSDFNVGNGRNYIEMRNEFSLEMDILSEETGIVMTIDEFEWAFIEHLRSLGVDI